MTAQVIGFITLQHNTGPLVKRAEEKEYCSFCGKDNTQVKVLVRNEKGTKLICNECAAKCRAIVRQQRILAR